MAAAGRALSARDKTQLKEKLVLLQREYRKTVSRLQRAERAERVKSHVKKTVAEQNSLLLQVAAEDSPAASTSQAAPPASESILAASRSAAKAPSVTFSLEPEVFGRECRLPENLGSECTNREHERISGGTLQPVPGGKLSRLSRSRRRGRPSVASQERREDAQLGRTGAGLEGPPWSPVFPRHGSTLGHDAGSLRASPAIPAAHSSSLVTPETPQQEDLLGSLGGDVVVPGVLQKGWGPSLERLREEGTFAAAGGPAVEATVFLADVQNVSKEKQGDGEEEEAVCGKVALPESRREAPHGRSPCGEPRSSRHCGSASPNVEPGKAGSSCEAEAAAPLLVETSPAAPSSSLLDSCTVVEGLIFPVEYYVRTTRRMSSCQRELNLAAVIQSQLGQRRRSQRASPKGSVGGPAPSSQGLPASPAEAGQERGGGSPTQASEGSPSPGGGVPPSGGPAQRGRRGKRKGTGRPSRGAPSRGTQGPSASVGRGGNGALTPHPCCSESQEPADDRDRAKVEQARGGQRGSRLSGAPPEPPSLGCPEMIPGGRQWLPCDLAPQEFRLPAEEFGLLQSERVRASAPKAPEAASDAGPAKCLPAVEDAAPPPTGERPGDLLPSPEEGPGSAGGPGELHTSKLLLSPAQAALEGGSPQPETSQLLSTPSFPLVGATPATQDLCDAPPQEPAGSPRELSSVCGKPVRGVEQEHRCRGALGPEDEGGSHWKRDEAAACAEARQELAAESGEIYGASADQPDGAAGDLMQGPRGQPMEGSLQMASRLQHPSGSCSVDTSAVWWEVAGSTQLCIATASEASVTLWRRLESGCWESAHTWSFAEDLVFQLIPLPGAHSLLCVALGGLEMAALRLLFRSLEDDCLKQSLVQVGRIKAVLGLSGRRLVSSCEGAVEVLSFPGAGGSCTRRALSPPKEAAVTFAAVDGMAEALVGLTAANSVVVWNLSSGQLLCHMPLGYANPVPVCHQAYSDSGLLFVVLSHPCAKEEDLCGSPAFQVVAFNPKTARSAQVMVASLPPGLHGRYQAGDVRDASGAALLTSGALAVWDLLGGECRALLPPSAEGTWSLVRWSVTDKCLLVGQTDGSVGIYNYAPGPCSAQRRRRTVGGPGSEPLPHRAAFSTEVG